jgi:hypothetical protein
MIFEELDFPKAIYPNPIASNCFYILGFVSAPFWVWSIFEMLAELRLDLTELMADFGL